MADEAGETLRLCNLSQKLLHIVSVESDSARHNANLLLDQLLSCRTALNSSQGKTLLLVLKKCCALINPKHEQLAVKSCMLINATTSRWKVILTQEVLDDCIDYLSKCLITCQSWAHAEVLSALASVLYDSAPKLSKAQDATLVGSSGILSRILATPTACDDVASKALQCLEFLCRRPYPTADPETAANCLRIFLDILQHVKLPPASKADLIISHCQFVSSALRGICNVMLSTRRAHLPLLGQLLAALKAFCFFGLGDTSDISRFPSCLHPVGLPSSIDPTGATDSGSSSVPVAKPAGDGQGGGGKKKKRNRRSGQHTGSNPDRAAEKLPEQQQQQQQDLLQQQHDVAFGAAADRLTKMTLADQDHVAVGSNSRTGVVGTRIVTPALRPPPPPWAPWWGSSDSEYSDTDSGRASKLYAQQSRVRQSALCALCSVVKGTDSRVVFGYWPSFVPSGPLDSRSNDLLALLGKDTSPKVRMAIFAVLSSLLEGTKQFLLVATESEQHNMPFTPFSISLGNTIKEMHRQLIALCATENSPLALTQLIKCLAVLVANSPYHKLKPGLLSDMFAAVRKHVHHRDINIRVACLTCFGAMVSIHAPLLEVCHILSTSGSLQSSFAAAAAAETRSDVAVAASATSAVSSSATVQPADKLPRVGSKQTSVPSTPDVTPVSGFATPAQAESAGSAMTAAGCGHDVPWVVRHCAANAQHTFSSAAVLQAASSSSAVVEEPLPVRLESLQVLCQLVAGYLPLVRHCLTFLIDLIVTCLQDSDPSVQLHGGKLLEDLTSALTSKQCDGKLKPRLDVSEAQEIWMAILGRAVPTAMQVEGGPASSALKAVCCNCLANIGPEVFDSLPHDRRITCITMLLGLATLSQCTSSEDKDVRGAAVRALGVFVLYPSLRTDPSFVADVAEAAVSCMDDSLLATRVKAAWALANTSDMLVLNNESPTSDMGFSENIPDSTVLRLFAASNKAACDGDKVRCNGVRSLGNLLRYISALDVDKPNFAAHLEAAIASLITSVSQGVMKVRWNACYGVGNLLLNTSVLRKRPEWASKAYSALCSSMSTSRNFKVRINAAWALSAPKQRDCFGSPVQFATLWQHLVIAMEESTVISDFTEYKYSDTLGKQLCSTLAHFASMIAVEDLTAVGKAVQGKSHSLQAHVTKFAEAAGFLDESSTPVASIRTRLLSLRETLERRSDGSAPDTLGPVGGALDTLDLLEKLLLPEKQSVARPGKLAGAGRRMPAPSTSTP